MSTVPNIAPQSTPRPSAGVSPRRLSLGRAVLTILWAAGLAIAGAYLTTGSELLLVAYPVIDIAASLIDARSPRRPASESAQRLLLVNAALSTGAVIALAITVASDTSTVLHVFGAWAAVSGLIQLAVVTRRRAQLGRQTAMLISGTLSTIAGVSFNVIATGSDPKLTILAGYAGLGAILYIVSAVRLPEDSRTMSTRTDAPRRETVRQEKAS